MKPQYRLKVLDKHTSRKGEVGAGWVNPDGSITIQLNPCIRLNADINQVLTLFPVDRIEENESIIYGKMPRKIRPSKAIL